MIPEDPQDTVERVLRADARHAIDDAGFTRRVMERLPARAQGARPGFRPALMLVSAVVGGALAYAFAPAGTSLAQGFLALILCGALMASALLVAVQE
jgi:hypothetical protein